MLDQRGTGYSQPSLGCPEIARDLYQSIDRHRSPARQAGLDARAARRCHDRLLRAGIDPRAFTTLEDAADVADLRRALGYKEVNLYGISYGTRLALTVMRAFPAGIRSVVLDSVVPPSFNLLTDPAPAAGRAFALLFAACRHSSGCARAYPRLERVFYTLVAHLNAHPLTLAGYTPAGRRIAVLLSGDRLVSMVLTDLYSASLIPYVPEQIAAVSDAVHAGASLPPQEFSFESNTNAGMTYAIECGDDAPSVTPARLTAANHALPPLLRPALLSYSLSLYAVCRVWGAVAAPAARRRAVVSAIPTLILSGQFDPITPPALGALAAHAQPQCALHLSRPGPRRCVQRAVPAHHYGGVHSASRAPARRALHRGDGQPTVYSSLVEAIPRHRDAGDGGGRGHAAHTRQARVASSSPASQGLPPRHLTRAVILP